MDILAEAAVRVTVLALGVAVVLRALQIRSPQRAHRAWTAVVVVMLLLPVFVAWGPELAVPIVPSQTLSRMIAPAQRDAAAQEPYRPPMTSAPSTDGAHTRPDVGCRSRWGVHRGRGSVSAATCRGVTTGSCNPPRCGREVRTTDTYGLRDANHRRHRRAGGHPAGGLGELG